MTIDPRDVLIDGATGQVIGPVPHAAKRLKPTFEAKAGERPRVLRSYRGFRPPPAITNRNPPPGPSADQFAAFLAQGEKIMRRYNKEVMKQNPLIGAIGEILLDQLKKKGRKK